MKIIFCTIHGYTHWEESLVSVINTREFQRLKRIRQLAAVHHVFPCATHTRFEHSLGVGHLAGRFAEALQKSQPDLQVPYLTLKLAGLVHDLGHGPLSHTYDRYSEDKGSGNTHEARSVALLRALVAKYSISIDPGVVEDACELIFPQTRALPAYLYQILSGPVDVDKLDYLRRDAKSTGMRFDVDIDRFFEFSRVVRDRLCFCHRRMPNSIAHVFFVRRTLHLEVYQHPVVRGIELMYIHLLRLLGTHALPFDDLTDDVFSHHFVELQQLRGHIGEVTAHKAHTLLTRIETRNIYRQIRDVPAPTGEDVLYDESTVAQGGLYELDYYDDRGDRCALPNNATALGDGHTAVVRFFSVGARGG